MEKDHLSELPLVSIIIPCYNSEHFIASAIQSAIDQTWQNKEIIVVDDGSGDSSLTRIKAFRDKVILLQQENKGASTARNLGLSVAKGSYVQFLDADDLLSADKIECQVIALLNTEHKVAVCDTIYFSDINTIRQNVVIENEKKFVYSSNNPIDFLINLWGGNDFDAWMIQTNAWLIPITLIKEHGKWNEELTLDDDGEFFARMVINSNGIVKTDGLNFYRKHSKNNSLSSRKEEKDLFSYLTSTLLKKKYLFEKSESVKAQKAVFKLLTDLATVCYLRQPKVYEKVRIELQKLPNFNYVPQLGGTLVNTLSKLIGWQRAKRFQHTLKFR